MLVVNELRQHLPLGPLSGSLVFGENCHKEHETTINDDSAKLRDLSLSPSPGSLQFIHV